MWFVSSINSGCYTGNHTVKRFYVEGYSQMTSITDGIVIGAAGGSIAGITVWLVQYIHDKVTQKVESSRVYSWLKKNTSNEPGDQFRSSRAIASWNNLTQERVRYICSVDKRIFLSTGEKDDMWGIYEHVPRSIYEKRGIVSI
jgi:hypothetical protein